MNNFNTKYPVNISKNNPNFDGDDFLNILESEQISAIIKNATSKWRERIFTPSITLAMFIKQALSPDRSCAHVVNEFIIDNIDELPINISTSTGSFCRSRQKIPLDLIKKLVRYTGNATKEKIDNRNGIKGNIYLVDGTTFTLPDTVQNQEKYPQQSAQKKGLGFPICRALGVFCLESGAAVNAQIAPYKGKGADEHTMLRSSLDTFKKGDLVIGDAIYSSYWLFSHLQKEGVEGIFGQNGGRAKKADFRTGKQIGKYDHIVTYKRPQRPEWMSVEQYKSTPKTISVRELKVRHKILVTTLCENKLHSKDAIDELYISRWNIGELTAA
ncbi:IS4 family transposase [Psychromonas antarctica]|uniref:IS4 family transposase n=1 Tax=Psychromonas antarctica TaxID=67573 RepID=UPI001EE79220|nr:IS4 family transposase [Psychromonas antarctica]MCG6202729.1 IS4 family transposase [Psychromonas antarctica]